MVTTGEIIADLRTSKKMTQAELGKIIGVAASTISSYEANLYRPDTTKLVLMANFFDVSVDYILGRSSLQIDVIKLFSKEYCDLISGEKQTLAEIITRIHSLDDESASDLIRHLNLLHIKLRVAAQ